MTKKVSVEKFYNNRGYYPYIPASVFSALEAAYIAGESYALVSMAEYDELQTNLKEAGLCRE